MTGIAGSVLKVVKEHNGISCSTEKLNKLAATPGPQEGGHINGARIPQNGHRLTIEKGWASPWRNCMTRMVKCIGSELGRYRCLDCTPLFGQIRLELLGQVSISLCLVITSSNSFGGQYPVDAN